MPASNATDEAAPQIEVEVADFDIQMILDQVEVVRTYVVEELFTVGSLLELAVIGLAFLLAMATDGWCSRLISVFHKQFLRVFRKKS